MSRYIKTASLVLAIGTAPSAVAQVSDLAANPPVPTANVGQWFGQDAYPVAAIRAGEQGRVVAILTIDATGRPTGCTVPVSSGSATLDEATCRIAMRRTTFTPARDGTGRAVTSQYRLPVRWILPASAAGLQMPLNASVLTQIGVATDGTVESCTSVPAIPGGCVAWPVGRKIMAPPMRDGRPVKAHVAISMDIATSLDP